ncbi:ninjurin-1-like [Adelges cooleyi]|uniref:ninjurin-1-like n=1 Tax=Adelges cooleyi TaxID=133065 RepID=UPI00217F7CEF|nr:ninjurin-1-like [Adelges cooleyi]
MNDNSIEPNGSAQRSARDANDSTVRVSYNPAGDDQTAENTNLIIDPSTTNAILDDDTPRAFNLYRNKKLISHGMMDVALFSANANQLRYVLETGNGDVFYVICVIMLLVSIVLQILVGITLLLSARYNVTHSDQRAMAFKLGNYVIVGIFLITVVNVFITSFGGPTVQPPTIMTNIVTELPSM